MIGTDFTAQVAVGNIGDEEVMGKFGIQDRNAEGQMLVVLMMEFAVLILSSRRSKNTG